MAKLDMQEFEKLYRTHYRRVRAIALKFGLREGAADDVIQETFIAAWEKQDSLKDVSAFGGWIATIARNNALQKLRSTKPHVPISATGERGEEDQESQDVILVADDETASLHWEHALGLLRDVIKAHKSEPRATVARLFYLENKTVSDIGAELKLKQNTVLSHLRRFRLAVSESVLQLIEEEGLALE